MDLWVDDGAFAAPHSLTYMVWVSYHYVGDQGADHRLAGDDGVRTLSGQRLGHFRRGVEAGVSKDVRNCLYTALGILIVAVALAGLAASASISLFCH